MCVSDLCHVYLYTTYVQCQQRSEESILSSETGVTEVVRCLIGSQPGGELRKPRVNV